MLDKQYRPVQPTQPPQPMQQQSYTEEFYQACVNGDFELALCLLKMGVNLNVRFEHGRNLLHIACMKNFYGLVQLLIKFGCNEFMRDNSGRSALHYAALNNSTAIVRYLVEKNTFSNDTSSSTDLLTKEFLNTQDVNGKTAIHLACENNFKVGKFCCDV
jgi:ankyrin repeat protein